MRNPIVRMSGKLFHGSAERDLQKFVYSTVEKDLSIQLISDWAKQLWCLTDKKYSSRAAWELFFIKYGVSCYWSMSQLRSNLLSLLVEWAGYSSHILHSDRLLRMSRDRSWARDDRYRLISCVTDLKVTCQMINVVYCDYFGGSLSRVL